MKQDRTEETLAPDPELGAALREIYGEPPMAEADRGALRRRVASAAELPLAKRRRSRASRWTAALVPLATAAGLAFLVWTSQADDTLAVGTLERPRLVQAEEELIAGDLSEREFLLRVTGRDNPEELLQLALETR